MAFEQMHREWNLWLRMAGCEVLSDSADAPKSKVRKYSIAKITRDCVVRRTTGKGEFISDRSGK